MWTLIIPSALAFCLSFAITPLVAGLAVKCGLVDDPKKRPHPAHTHQGIIPRAGGLCLLIGIVIPSLVYLPLNKVLIGILAAAVLTVVIGLIDDWQDLSPYLRFIGNIVTASIVVGVGVGIPFITNPFNGVVLLDTWRINFSFLGNHSILVWADLFALLWLVWTMNIVGWSSGVDGQMPGFIAISAFVLGILSLRFSAHDISQTTVAALAFIISGAFLGFLPWNFYPQKIMPGYGGKTLAGLMIATLAILSGGKVGTALLVLAMPMMDAAHSLIRRLLRKKSPFKADRGHLHHRLLALGWGKRRIALFYWLTSAILGILALILTSQQKVFIFLIVGLTMSGIFLWLSLLFHQPRHVNHD